MISLKLAVNEGKKVYKLYKSMISNLMVENVDRAIAFYKELLNFTVVTSVPGKGDALQFAILAKDGLTLMLEEREALIEEYPILKTAKVQPSISIYIAVDDLDELYRDIKAKHPIYTELHTTFYGAREFAITDADGYVLTFTEHKEG